MYLFWLWVKWVHCWCRCFFKYLYIFTSYVSYDIRLNDKKHPIRIWCLHYVILLFQSLIQSWVDKKRDRINLIPRVCFFNRECQYKLQKNIGKTKFPSIYFHVIGSQLFKWTLYLGQDSALSIPKISFIRGKIQMINYRMLHTCHKGAGNQCILSQNLVND